MKEQEFDIYVRNTLRNAEESVSPEVWEGVAAGLERRRKVVPFWRYAAASVAAAAAVVAGFVFLKPSAGTIEEHSQPTSIFIVESSEATPQEAPSVPEGQEEVLPIRKQIAGKQVRTAHQLPALQEPVGEPVAMEEPGANEPALAQEEVPATIPSEAFQESAPAEEPVSAGEDNVLLEKLAREEDRQEFHRGFGFTASGNVQGNQRREVGSKMPPRQFGAPSAAQGKGIYNASPETSFSLPLSAAIGITYSFAPQWSVGTGVRYTYMGRTFTGQYNTGEGYWIPFDGNAATDIDNLQHWVGVPVNFYFSFLNQSRWHVHVFTGGAVEFLVRNDYLIHNTPKDIHFIEKSSAPQWSADLGVGIEYQLSPFLSLYLDPQFRYYFATQNQPRSLRTIQPLRFDIEAGLRFNLGR